MNANSPVQFPKDEEPEKPKPSKKEKNLPDKETTLPDKETTLPDKETNLPDKETNLPGAILTTPPTETVPTTVVYLSMPAILTQDITAFHEKFGLAYDGGPRASIGLMQEEFRTKTMQEELDEWKEAVRARHPEKMLDALVDLVYFTIGTAYLHGWDFDEAWRRVHAANMSKERATDINPGKRESKFDVVKPLGWKAPDLSDLV